MRPPTHTVLALCALLVATLLLAAAPALAEDLPPGFTDGRPVGDADGGSPEPASEPAVAAAVTQRYFGAEAFDSIRASVTATSRGCPITDDGLTALVLAPVFKESSAATTASTAPAPMTLSRYDEWTGTYSTSTNADANYGLYAFRNPYTSYSKAYWHPGIGIWQYDSAGIGAPFTAVERMNTGIMAADVAATMASRYCNPSSTQAGHGPPFSDQERRYAAWGPWGYPCTLCQGFFEEMMNPSPHFANLHMVGGITPLGGTVERTCTLAGESGTVPCWYVEPRVGVIQGATAWATFQPDGGSPTSPPAPLSAPFYVVDRGFTEERHWLTEDTGYAIAISAVRTIGKNARPRSSQAGSGLDWASSSGLCDLSNHHGACPTDPTPPAGMSSASIVAGSGFRPVSLDADGDGRGDVLWYRPGSGPDYLWLGTGGGSFQSLEVSVGGTYDDVLTGDVDGDGDDDVLWYARSSGSSYLWRADGDGTFTSQALAPGTGRRPLLLDTDGGGDVEVLWYGPGAVPDSLWRWVGTGFVPSARSVSGTYQPLVGDLDGNGLDDILWYGPGGAPDHLWLHSVYGGYVSKSLTVRGTYTPIVGDLDGDDADDVFWYAAGSAGDTVWFGAPGGAFVGQSASVSGTYQPFVAALDGTGRDRVVWYAPGLAGDYLWSWSAGRSVTSSSLDLPGQHQPVVGAFSAGGADGVLWYDSAGTDVVWYR